MACGSSITLYAVWEQASISITGSPQTYGVVGTSWSYTPTVMRTEFHEEMHRYRKLRGMPDAVVGELCLDYLVCKVCEDTIGDDEDFDLKVRRMKENVLKALR